MAPRELRLDTHAGKWAPHLLHQAATAEVRRVPLAPPAALSVHLEEAEEQSSPSLSTMLRKPNALASCSNPRIISSGRCYNTVERLWVLSRTTQLLAKGLHGSRSEKRPLVL